MPIDGYLGLLRTKGTFIQVGIPDDGPLPVPVGKLLKGQKLGGSGIGSPNDLREMFKLAAEKKIKPWIEERSMKDANQAVIDMTAGKARFRYVLVNEQHL